MSNISSEIEAVSEHGHLALVLAGQIVRLIEELGAAKDEVLCALAVVYGALPILKISTVAEEDWRISPLQAGA